ncbi:MAG TPA: enoyl-CoA hydratase-related protein [Vicinamibacteria bacterium]|nr:enoyl-CoA hydratase-related protein [Vicinamibacteria bacterium]
MADPVRCAIEGGVATVTLARPEKRNALDTPTVRGLGAAFDRCEADRSVRVVVVRGEGPAFCAGMDLDELRRQQQAPADPEHGVTLLLQRIERFPLPTIAMIQGPAMAGGCELALHCDLRLAADTARFAMPLARLGLIVPFPLGRKLVEELGPGPTRELLYTGQTMDARRALEIGLVHRVVPPAALAATTYELARAVAANAPLALAGLKAVVARALSARAQIAHADLDEAASRVRRSADAREGVTAMLEKRPPVFRGE